MRNKYGDFDARARTIMVSVIFPRILQSTMKATVTLMYDYIMFSKMTELVEF